MKVSLLNCLLLRFHKFICFRIKTHMILCRKKLNRMLLPETKAEVKVQASQGEKVNKITEYIDICEQK